MGTSLCSNFLQTIVPDYVVVFNEEKYLWSYMSHSSTCIVKELTVIGSVKSANFKMVNTTKTTQGIFPLFISEFVSNFGDILAIESINRAELFFFAKYNKRPNKFIILVDNSFDTRQHKINF